MENKKEQLRAAITLLTRLPPSKMNKNQVGLINLAPDLEDNLLESVDLPHKLEKDPVTGELFICTEFNRDGASYRSPYSNVYVPPEADAYFPSYPMREFEVKCNQLFQEYTHLYYDNGVGNFFVSENEEGLNCGFFAKKGTTFCHVECDPDNGLEGHWDSFNTITVRVEGAKVIYNLNTTVMVEMKIANGGLGYVYISGYRREHKKEYVALPEEREREAFHIAKIGRMIEYMETKLRNDIQLIYVSKTQDIIFNSRFESTREEEDLKRRMANRLMHMRE